jgi:hypothetical protein
VITSIQGAQIDTENPWQFWENGSVTGIPVTELGGVKLRRSRAAAAEIEPAETGLVFGQV